MFSCCANYLWFPDTASWCWWHSWATKQWAWGQVLNLVMFNNSDSHFKCCSIKANIRFKFSLFLNQMYLFLFSISPLMTALEYNSLWQVFFSPGFTTLSSAWTSLLTTTHRLPLDFENRTRLKMYQSLKFALDLFKNNFKIFWLKFWFGRYVWVKCWDVWCPLN